MQLLITTLTTLWIGALLLLIVRAVLGIRGKVVKGPHCKNCGYNRTGIPNESPCPECGLAPKREHSKLHIQKRWRFRNTKRIAIDLIMIVLLIALSIGGSELNDYRVGYYIGFIQSIQDGDLNAVQAYLDRFPELAQGQFRYDDNVNDPGGPIHAAVQYDGSDRMKIIKLLLDNNPNVDIESYLAALDFALRSNDRDAAKALFDSGLSLESATAIRYVNLLPYAAGRRGCDAEIVQMMLDHGADPNLFLATTALSEAIYRRDRYRVMKMLLDAGADPNLPGNNGYAPIFIAVEHGRVQAVEILIDAGADINALYANRMTPLDLAEQYIQTGSHRGQDHASIARVLLANGAKRAAELEPDQPAEP